jgi:hypothetical protein
MAKKKKPYVDMDIECPHCKWKMSVKRFRTRTNPADPPEYSYEQEVQLILAPSDRDEKAGDSDGEFKADVGKFLGQESK